MSAAGSQSQGGGQAPGGKNEKEEIYTIVVVGDGGVGKSALTIQFVESTFVTEYNPTIEDSFTKKTRIDAGLCLLKIFDTAGQEEYSALAETHFNKANGFLIVYSVADRTGFDSVARFRTRILAFFDSNEFPMAMAGNKCDLTADRVVSTQEGADLAHSFGGIPFRETSAKTNTNVEAVFSDLVRVIRKMPKSWLAKRAALDNPAYFKKKRCVIS